jgi:hypothetical protein
MTPGSQTNHHHLPQLVELAGLVDGLHWPYRQHGGRVSVLTSIVQQRRACRERGLVWSLADGTARGWKSAQRLRDSMQAAGLVEVNRDGELRVRLTTQGDTLARQSMALPTINSWLPRRLLDLLTELPEDRPEQWVSELAIAGTEGDKQALANVMMPLLTGGFVESLSSTSGEIFYRKVNEPPASPEDAPESSNDEQGDHLNEVYSQAFEAALSGRERIEPADSELVIPLGASKP